MKLDVYLTLFFLAMLLAISALIGFAMVVDAVFDFIWMVIA